MPSPHLAEPSLLTVSEPPSSASAPSRPSFAPRSTVASSCPLSTPAQRQATVPFPPAELLTTKAAALRLQPQGARFLINLPDRRPLRTSPDSRSQGSNRRSPSSVQTLPHRPHGSADRIACCAAHVTAAPRRATTPGSPRKPLCSRISGRRPRGQRSNLAGACSATAPRRHRRAAAQPHRFSSRQASLEPSRGVVSRPPCPRGPPSRGRPWGTAITHSGRRKRGGSTMMGICSCPPQRVYTTVSTPGITCARRGRLTLTGSGARFTPGKSVP